uniref:Odorant receptor n=1 Tax=Glossina morsitans morsitans TaxID=37546 RepID=A0A1B0GFU8_GLOMM
MNLLYRPKLSDGKLVRLSWPIAMFRLTHIVCWPLEDDAPRWAYVFDRFCWFLAFIVFVLTNDAELRYLRVNMQNLDELLNGVPTYLVLIEAHIRGFTLGYRKNKFKNLLRKFYTDIYVDERQHPSFYKKIQPRFWPLYVFSSMYVATLTNFIVTPLALLLTRGSRELTFKMIPLFDYRYFPIYLPCLLSNIWVGFLVVSLFSAEPNILGLVVLHLHSRYLIMNENLRKKTENLLKNPSNTEIARRFRKIVVETIDENKRLNLFAQEIQNEFSFRIFILFSFAAMCLCAVASKVYMNPLGSFAYIFWMFGKIQELMIIGDLGSTIIATTDEVSTMYYNSNWESVIARSSDSCENVRLMKLLTMAIALNRKPFYLTGLNFFTVSLNTVIKILQGAGSYFTCLISFR